MAKKNLRNDILMVLERERERQSNTKYLEICINFTLLILFLSYLKSLAIGTPKKRFNSH